MPTLWLSGVALLLLRRLKLHTDIVLSESPVRNVGILLFCASLSHLAPIGYYFEPEVLYPVSYTHLTLPTILRV